MPDFANACAYLNGLQKFGIKLGLEQVSELLAAAGSPESRLRFIHVAGSNGKGSLSAMLSAALCGAGFKVGLFTSPHLISPRERIRLNGAAISEADFSELVFLLRPFADKMALAGRCPTYFEFTTVMAALYFARYEVDWVVWETGMGGRLDSTNVVIPYCSVITGIALEHQKYLGDTIAKIAFEKAGIIKKGRPVFCGRLPDAALKVISESCREAGSQLNIVQDGDCADLQFDISAPGYCRQSFDYEGFRIKLGLAGKFQRQNFKLAFMLLKHIAGEFSFPLENVLAGLENVRWPARIQFMPDGSIIDGGHNPDGAAALMESLSEIFPGQKFSIVFGNFADKDSEQILKIMSEYAEEFIFVPLQGGDRRSRTGAELSVMLGKISGVPCVAASSIEEAMKLNVSARRLITGSLYLAGDALRMLCTEDEILNI
ncbi:MAG: folylpolyglutamate synthase/dihydrofolate synthase family protein [Victivallaceae bacterium]|jgi:dihydrofolate synthase/folylpolyglutamate synthase